MIYQVPLTLIVVKIPVPATIPGCFWYSTFILKPICICTHFPIIDLGKSIAPIDHHCCETVPLILIYPNYQLYYEELTNEHTSPGEKPKATGTVFVKFDIWRSVLTLEIIAVWSQWTRWGGGSASCSPTSSPCQV